MTGSIEDRLAIRERLEAYASAVFRRDADGWAANWDETATWNLAGMEVAGRANIVALWNGAMAGFSFVAFFVQPGEISISADRATCVSYTAEDLVEAGGKARRVIGRYDDELIKRAGVWLFTRRVYSILRDT